MTRHVKQVRVLLPVYVLMLAVIFALPRFSVVGYSIVKNTTSQLGAQSAPNAWVMNIIFVLLGAASIFGGWAKLREYWFHRIILTIFGVSLILTAVFQHAPIKAGVPFDLQEDRLHSLFSSACGFSFAVFAVSAAFVEVTAKRRMLAVMTGVSATFLSFLMFNVAEYAGIWQRLIFILSFVWLMFFFEERRSGESCPD